MVSNSYRKYRTTNKNFESSEKKGKFFFSFVFLSDNETFLLYQRALLD